MAVLFAVSAYAATLTDIEKHWGKEYIEYGVEKGYISGFEDNTFRPDEKVTRAQFAKMINGAVNITSISSISFDDVARNDWFYSDIQKAQFAAYVLGYENNDGSFSFKPNNPITRQEAAVILSRIVLPTAKKAELSSFKDGATIDTWAVNEVLMIAAKGYINGDENKNFSPKGALTRAAAAKLICEFVKNENIVNGEYEIEKESTVSETLFTDDVIVETEEEADIIFKNCRILGNLTVKSSDVAVSLENSAVAFVVNNGEDDVSVAADETSSVRVAKINYPCHIRGNSFAKLSLVGKNLSSGTVEVSGNIAEIEVDGDATIKISGTVDEMEISGKSNLLIQSGTVEKLTVDKSAQGSTINLATKVVVEKATNNGAVSYVGSGTIEEANNAVEGVSYETKPLKVTGKNSEGDKESDEDFFDDVTVSPTKGKTGVTATSNIVFTFKSAVTNDDGKALTATYLEDEFELRKTSASGSKVTFDATINSTKKIITLNPASTLSAGTKYYVVIPAGVLTYSDGTTNEKYTTYFTVASSDDDDESDSSGMSIKFDPEDGEDEVPIDTEIEINFSKKIYKKGGSSVTTTYLEDTAIQLREGSSSGTLIDFSAEINSSARVVTIKPNSNLKPGETYYVIIVSGKLEDADENLIGKKTIDFETENNLPVKITPANERTNVSEHPTITLEFTEALLTEDGDDIDEEYIADEVIELRKSSTSGAKVADFTVEISSNRRKISITPDEALVSGTRYYVIIKAGTLMGEDSEAENKKITSYFTVASAMAPVVTPAMGEQNASVGTEITVSFRDKLYTPGSNEASRLEITPKYIIDNEVVLLRYKTSGGKIEECDVSISSDGKTITLQPKQTLEVNQKYYIVIKKDLLSNKTGTKNTAYTTYFETNEVLVPTFTPKDEDEDVDVDSVLYVKFNESIYNDSGKTLTKAYVADNVIRLYKNSKSEANRVDFSIVLDGNTIKVDPDAKLESDTTYYLEVLGGKITNSNEQPNPGYTISFTTEFVVDTSIEFYPGDRKTGVSTQVNPSFTFASSISKKGGGNNMSASYLGESIYMTEGSKKTSGGVITNLVPAEIIVSDNNKVFTIVPDEDLNAGKTYYVYIVSGKLAYSNDTSVSAKTYNFTTISDMPEISVDDYSYDETSLTVEYTASNDGKLYVVATPDEGDEKSVSKNITAGSGEITLEGLSASTAYDVVVTLETSSVEVTDEFEFTTKASEEETPECTFCGEAHKDGEHVCSKCGKPGHETETWCNVCENHTHNTEDCEIANPECTFCGKAHKNEEHVCSKCGKPGHETETWCNVCENHTHNTDAHCEKCGELDCNLENWCDTCSTHDHTADECPEQEQGGGEGAGDGAGAGDGDGGNGAVDE